MAQHLIINLGTKEDILSLKFRIRNTPVADQWVQLMERRNKWPLDHPDRFYDFNSPAQERAQAETYIQQCIDTINSYQPIIDRQFDWTQDCLNYLHNIFERYHGLLDQQNTDFWNTAPVEVRRALAELNLAVHRCEGISNGTQPRFVCTWYGMPKTDHLSVELQQEYGELSYRFGTVYLNYVEIGKTVENLTHDQDAYIGDDAFKPFDFYSADFRVTFFNEDIRLKLPAMNEYIQQHQEFFLARGIENVYNVRAMPYKFPVADIVWTGTQEELIKQMQTRQHIMSVELK